MNSTRLDLIDAYFRNELSADELSRFEQAMQADPVFHDQIKLEAAVRKGIGEYRKAELKARLSAIEVGPAVLGGAGHYGAAIKILAGGVGAAVIGVAGYLYFTSSPQLENALTAHEFISIDYPAIAQTHRLIIPDITIPLETVPIMIDQPQGVRSEARVNTAGHQELITQKENSRNLDFEPQIIVPQPDDLMVGETFESPDAEMPDISNNDEISLNESSVAPVDVEAVNRRNETLKYKYFDGKLFLYGDFSEHPYEILEINSPTSRKLYLYHRTMYYSISVTDKVQELIPITDKKLLDELKIIRNNKL